MCRLKRTRSRIVVDSSFACNPPEAMRTDLKMMGERSGGRKPALQQGSGGVLPFTLARFGCGSLRRSVAGEQSRNRSEQGDSSEHAETRCDSRGRRMGRGAAALVCQDRTDGSVLERGTPRRQPSWGGLGRMQGTCPASSSRRTSRSLPTPVRRPGANLIVVAIPSAYLRGTLEGLVERIPPGIPMLSVVKGIENETLLRPSQIIVEILGTRPVAVLSGPSHAEELARGLPASVVVAGDAEDLNVEIRDALNQGTFRVYTNPDLIGVELAGALANLLESRRGSVTDLGSGTMPRPRS